MKSLQNLLNTFQASRALILDDLIEGMDVDAIKRDLAATTLDVPQDIIDFWQIIGGTRQPKGTDSQFVEKRRLDGFYIYGSPRDATTQYLTIQSDKKQGFEDFLNFPDSCLPIAVSIFGQILSIECEAGSARRGQVFEFDPPTGEHKRVAVSLDAYFQTVHAAFESGIIALDEKKEIEVKDFDAYFALASKLNPDCDFWTS